MARHEDLQPNMTVELDRPILGYKTARLTEERGLKWAAVLPSGLEIEVYPSEVEPLYH